MPDDDDDDDDDDEYDSVLGNNLVRKRFLSRHCLQVSDLGFRSTTFPGIMQYYVRMAANIVLSTNLVCY